MGWTITELQAALDIPAAKRTADQDETIRTAARMFLHFLEAQQQRLLTVTAEHHAPRGSANALANAALDVINLVLNSDEFVPRGKVTFSVMDLQIALFAYRGMETPAGDATPTAPAP